MYLGGYLRKGEGRYLVPFPSVNILSSEERKNMADKYKECTRIEHKKTNCEKGKRGNHKEEYISRTIRITSEKERM